MYALQIKSDFYHQEYVTESGLFFLKEDNI
jgi:hypothetical protein